MGEFAMRNSPARGQVTIPQAIREQAACIPTGGVQFRARLAIGGSSRRWREGLSSPGAMVDSYVLLGCRSPGPCLSRWTR